MRTLSARILLGFAALTVTFGVITATVVFNMQKVEHEIQLVRLGYLPIALTSKDLERRQDDLKAYLDEVYEDDPNTVPQIRSARDQALKRLRQDLTAVEQLPDVGPREFAVPHARLDTLEREIAATLPLYSRLTRAKTPDREDALGKLRSTEQKIGYESIDLARALEQRVRHTMIELEESEHRIRIATIYLGLVAVILGLLITIWVVITLRPLQQLREAARRVAAGDYGSRIAERGPTEVSDLAREFNSIGRAVEERERELVRSERLAAVGKMAAMITHEVRNPLSSIGLNTELLEDELAARDGVDEAKALCSAIHREVDRLTAITEEYLAFARLPKPKIAREPVNALVGALAAFVREDLAARHVELATELAPSEPQALIDAAQLRQCLINLVRNAADAVVAKGGGHVTLRTRSNGERVVIDVEDDGTGIAADVLPRLFDPFFSTKESGSGLGLALTQQIVKDHGGDLDVESAVGRGTTFRVSVPAVP